jgi:hypothetical protein
MQIFLTSVNEAGELLLLCLDTKGQQQWQQVVAKGNQNSRGDEGNSASPSTGDGWPACLDIHG